MARASLAVALFGLALGACAESSSDAADGKDAGLGGAGGSAGSPSGGSGGAAGSAGAAGAAGASGAAGAAGTGGTSGAAGSGGAPSGGAGGTAGTGGVGGAGGTGGAPVDPCQGKTVSCPSLPPGFAAGSGLSAIERCAFPIDEGAEKTQFAPLVDALAKALPNRTVSDLAGDLNRSAVAVSSVPGGPPGVVRAFRWEDAENDKPYWIPQGISGSADAHASGLVAGRHWVVVSFYYDKASHPGSTGEKGVRLAFVDVTPSGAPKYRFVLLVEPTGTASAPSFKAIPIHAGGIAWFGNLLYVADTFTGFRVFDTSRFLQVATDQDVIGCSAGTCRAGLYKYVLPQVGTYREASSCAPRFSFVSVDRSSTPPSLISGEYCSGSSCSAALSGRLFRWPLDAASGAIGPGRHWPAQAFFGGQVQVQGAGAKDGTFFLSSSAPSGAGGALYRVTPGKSATSKWVDAPEDVVIDGPRDLIWSLSEQLSSRVVFAAKLASYPKP